ncbi:nucleotidyl transferase AbiEii/AbiGii toxin family protein [Candidatus Uhrbacteria bacterium]|nr:nucleotidyl transferase AbiEii/AbiGii toxin family protein [Candidatus Uhrbacteria bacterium]
MFTLNQIRTSLGLTEHQGQPEHLLTEYLQCQLLDSLFLQESSKHLSFIGGTAIRIVYGGSRFSEDLDFDNFGLSFQDFQDLISETMSDMRQKGYEVDGRFVEKDAFHCYIKFPKILFDHGLSPMQTENILIRIDTVKKDRIITPQPFILNRFDVYRTVIVNPVTIILSQKLIAILGRKREKGRDFFDVSFLWGQTEPDFHYIEAVTGMGRDAFFVALQDRCANLSFSILANDVEPFLIYPEQKNRVTDFFAFLEQKIEAMKNG